MLLMNVSETTGKSFMYKVHMNPFKKITEVIIGKILFYNGQFIKYMHNAHHLHFFQFPQWSSLMQLLQTSLC